MILEKLQHGMVRQCEASPLKDLEKEWPGECGFKEGKGQTPFQGERVSAVLNAAEEHQEEQGMDMFVRLSDSKACDLVGVILAEQWWNLSQSQLCIHSVFAQGELDVLVHLFYREMSNAEICIICVRRI